MKNLHLLILLLILFFQGFTQKIDQRYLPEIKAGTLFKFEFEGKDEAASTQNGKSLFVLSDDKEVDAIYIASAYARKNSVPSTIRFIHSFFDLHAKM